MSAFFAAPPRPLEVGPWRNMVILADTTAELMTFIHSDNSFNTYIPKRACSVTGMSILMGPGYNSGQILTAGSLTVQLYRRGSAVANATLSMAVGEYYKRVEWAPGLFAVPASTAAVAQPIECRLTTVGILPADTINIQAWLEITDG